MHAMAGTTFRPNTRREVLTVANWTLKRIRLMSTDQYGELGTTLRAGVLLPLEVDIPQWEHDAVDARFGQFVQGTSVLFQWRQLYDLLGADVHAGWPAPERCLLMMREGGSAFPWLPGHDWEFVFVWPRPRAGGDHECLYVHPSSDGRHVLHSWEAPSAAMVRDPAIYGVATALHARWGGQGWAGHPAQPGTRDPAVPGGRGLVGGHMEPAPRAWSRREHRGDGGRPRDHRYGSERLWRRCARRRRARDGGRGADRCGRVVERRRRGRCLGRRRRLGSRGGRRGR